MKRFCMIILIFNIVIFMAGVESKASEIDALTATLNQRQGILDSLIEEVTSLSVLVDRYKTEAHLLPLVDTNISAVEENSKILMALLDEVRAIMLLTAEIEMDIELDKKLNENMKKIEYLQSKIELIMAELEGINRVIIAVEGRNKFYCDKGAIFSVLITGKNIQTNIGAEVIIDYDPQYYEVMDLIGITSELELSPIHIENYGIEVKNHDTVTGKIILELSKNEITGSLWSGILNSVKFQCIKEADKGINITINER